MLCEHEAVAREASRFKRAFWLIGGAIVGGFIGRFGGWTGCVIGTMSDADKKNLVDGVQVLVESKSIDDLISFSDKQKQREKLLTLKFHISFVTIQDPALINLLNTNPLVDQLKIFKKFIASARTYQYQYKLEQPQIKKIMIRQNNH
ncbi:hypothetical protein KUTeg_018078 [Tegillarca granosa]|uniref:Uncharacterized protein n=1 Tax=Tegillarca granosa TaxID=220873 RepID=A0ABQ9ELQ9_TEGGR|nr:hypothetical protein KUTeg_018078 [Tegillarca granosa]